MCLFLSKTERGPFFQSAGTLVPFPDSGNPAGMHNLAEGTVQGTISHMVQTFRAKGRQNPTKDGILSLAVSFYQDCSEPSETMIPKKSNKEPFHLL
jgi:hypothetical protein